VESHRVKQSHADSPRVTQSHAESSRVTQSHAESRGVMRSHGESLKILWSYPESHEVTQSHAKSCKVMQSHTESQKSPENIRIDLSRSNFECIWVHYTAQPGFNELEGRQEFTMLNCFFFICSVVVFRCEVAPL
jgi:hypothetical protein